jgi:hypothetical protein
MELILKLLQLDDYYGKSRNIDTAKGINKMPLTIKEALEQTKRKKAWQ